MAIDKFVSLEQLTFITHDSEHVSGNRHDSDIYRNAKILGGASAT